MRQTDKRAGGKLILIRFSFQHISFFPLNSLQHLHYLQFSTPHLSIHLFWNINVKMIISIFNSIYKNRSPFNFPQNLEIDFNFSKLTLKFRNISKMITFLLLLGIGLFMLHITKCIADTCFWLKRNIAHANAGILRGRGWIPARGSLAKLALSSWRGFGLLVQIFRTSSSSLCEQFLW